MALRVRLEHKPRRRPPAERARLGLQWRAFWRIRMADLVQRVAGQGSLLARQRMSMWLAIRPVLHSELLPDRCWLTTRCESSVATE
jgi:hypothetical protein